MKLVEEIFEKATVRGFVDYLLWFTAGIRGKKLSSTFR